MLKKTISTKHSADNLWEREGIVFNDGAIAFKVMPREEGTCLIEALKVVGNEIHIESDPEKKVIFDAKWLEDIQTLLSHVEIRIDSLIIKEVKRIFVNKELLATHQYYLDRSNPKSPTSSSVDILTTFAVDFDDGYKAEIRVCNSDYVFVESVLLNKGGTVCQTLEPRQILRGLYQFDRGDKTYIVGLEYE